MHKVNAHCTHFHHVYRPCHAHQAHCLNAMLLPRRVTEATKLRSPGSRVLLVLLRSFVWFYLETEYRAITSENQRRSLKGGMLSSPEIHGFSPGGFQYGVFRISVRIPIFAMAKMSPRESHFLVVDVVRWARNLHMFNSTHQDLTLHRECRLISDGITPYCLKK